MRVPVKAPRTHVYYSLVWLKRQRNFLECMCACNSRVLLGMYVYPQYRNIFLWITRNLSYTCMVPWRHHASWCHQSEGHLIVCLWLYACILVSLVLLKRLEKVWTRLANTSKRQHVWRYQEMGTFKNFRRLGEDLPNFERKTSLVNKIPQSGKQSTEVSKLKKSSGSTKFGKFVRILSRAHSM